VVEGFLSQVGQDAFLNRTSAARIGVCACATNIPSAMVMQESTGEVVQNRPLARHQITSEGDTHHVSQSCGAVSRGDQRRHAAHDSSPYRLRGLSGLLAERTATCRASA
jgi:hypothetical protein